MLKNSSNLYGSEWLALVFRNRNQSYGAYVLRSESAYILLKSLMIVAPFFILLFVGPSIYSQLKGKPVEVDLAEKVLKVTDVTIHEIKPEQPKMEQPIEKAEKKVSAPPVQQAVKTTAFTNKIQIVDEPAIEPPTSVDLQQSAIGSVSQDGKTGVDNTTTSGDVPGGTGSSTTGTATGTEIVEFGGVEVYPEFPGGMAAWSKFIQKNLRYPYAAEDAGVQGKVYLSFVVEKDGAITDVKVIRGIGYGCDDEAVRVIKKSPRWKPGMQNKQLVRVRYQMPISYTITQ